MAGSLMEPFIESLQALPCNVKRYLSLLKDLDSKVSDLTNRAEQMSNEYVNNVKDLSPEEKNARAKQVLELYDEAMNFSEEKKLIAAQAYNIVDKQIRQLDFELSKFVEDKGALALEDAPKKKRKKPSKEKSKIGNDNKDDTQEAALQSTSGLLAPTNEILQMDIDPNEPTYCFCQTVSYGEMIACDDAACEFEWFHFSCVGLTQKPKNRNWFCPDCIKKKKESKQ